MEVLVATSVLAVALGGVSKGLNGFGHALIATSLTATVVAAPEAVAIVIPSLIAANLELLSGLNRAEVSKIFNRFKYYIVTAFIGVTVGMAGIDFLPAQYLMLAVGTFAVLYASFRTSIFSNFASKLRGICFKSHETGIGFLTGLVYGSTNVALLAVSYLESRELGLRKFKGTLALFVLGLSTYRLFLASALGLFQGTEKLMLSLALVVPTVIGVKAGEKLAGRFEEEKVRKVSLALIALIGLRILTTF